MMQLDDRRFNQLALLAMSFALLLVTVAFSATVGTAVGNQRANRLVDHTYQVTDELDRLGLAVERTETATRGYLLAPDPIRIRAHKINAALVEPSLDRLTKLTEDNPRQQRTIAVLRPKVEDQVATTDDMMARAEKGQLASAREEFLQRVKVRQIDEIRDLMSSMRAEENRLLAERGAAERRNRSQLQWVLGATGVLLLILFAGAFWLVRRYMRDLTSTRDRLHLLNAGLEGAVAERTADLKRANDEIQRFAYIVSHDLRSPLVNILGFTAELETTNKSLVSLIERAERDAPQIVTEDTRHAREDLPEAIGFIRTSTQKMDRLINAILKLSREGRRNLAPEHLPMKRVLGDIAATLEHRVSERGATIVIDEDVPDITSDRIAIEQIFSNLMENALKYLQPGRPGRISVGGTVQGGRAIYDVKDNGRGIDPKDHERIFDLFRRSGSQDQPGEGIGLAHVRALAYRLGGFIDVESTLGEGSTFRLNLPVTYADQGVGN